MVQLDWLGLGCGGCWVVVVLYEVRRRRNETGSTRSVERIDY